MTTITMFTFNNSSETDLSQLIILVTFLRFVRPPFPSFSVIHIPAMHYRAFQFSPSSPDLHFRCCNSDWRIQVLHFQPAFPPFHISFLLWIFCGLV